MAVEKFLVEASHIMMFARSVGDANQIYYDPEYAQTTEPGSIIAPPTFAQSSAQFDPASHIRTYAHRDTYVVTTITYPPATHYSI